MNKMSWVPARRRAAFGTALSASLVASVSLLTGASPAAEAAAPALSSGLDLQYMDTSVRPQDDFYRYVNGKWLATKEIPADKGAYGAFYELRDNVQEQLRPLIDDLPRILDAGDPDLQKITDLYASFLDEQALESLAGKPLKAEFTRINGVKDTAGIAALIAHLNRIGVPAPYTPNVHLDAKDTTRYVFDLGEDGLGLPDRDYYLKDDDKLVQIRGQYREHMQRMLGLAGDRNAAADAAAILKLETALAQVQWTKVENRDPVKTYNKVALDKLGELAPGYAWKAYLAESGVEGKVGYVIVSQPSYLTAFARIVQETPLPVWKSYFRWHVLNTMAPYLSKAFVDENFAFYGKALRDVPENRPRWKRGLALVEQSMGEGLGKAYVKKYFPPASKARMDQLVQNLLAAYKADIDTLEWMSPATREKARAKLAKFTVKIGYPVKWRDYSALKIDRKDLAGNVVRAAVFEYNRNLAKLGQPVDRSEWEMSPQTVNAYYDPEYNEIVFPAAILQPPFFNAGADDAVNYGGIGAVIGHEISHGFDDQGSQYDGDGKVMDPPGWFTQADLDKYKARTHALVEQYSAYAPVPGFPINGELTLGENIADNSGMAIAYKAYRLSLGGKDAPVLDGLTGDQRFFMGWAQVWRSKARDKQAILLIKSDPHSPGQFRGLLPEMNQAAFYSAFDIKPGDKMYLAPEKRVAIW
jgi:predicted metalloendopeptidase